MPASDMLTDHACGLQKGVKALVRLCIEIPVADQQSETVR